MAVRRVEVEGRRASRLDGWMVPVVVAVGLAPLLVAALAGATSIPRNDDWSYQQILWRWADTGELRLNGWVSMFLHGQLAAARPVAVLFPDSALALQLWTSAIGIVGLLALLGTLRSFLSTGRALLVVVITALGPLYGPLAASFMTDVPAFAAQTCCLWLGTRALRAGEARRRLAWFAAALAVGVAGATVREYAIVAPLAVAVTLLARSTLSGERGTARREAVGLWLLAGVAIGGYLLVLVGWRRTVPGSLLLEPGIPTDPSELVRSATFTLATLTFLTLPVLAFLPWRAVADRLRAGRVGTALAAAVTVLLLAGLATWTWSPPVLGPYLDQRGALGNDVLDGDRGLLAPGPVWRVLLAACLVGTVAVVAIVTSTGSDLWRRRRDRSAWSAGALAWVFVVGTVAALVAAGAGGLPLFDRYLLAGAPLAAGVLLAWDGRGRAPLITPGALGGARLAAVGAFVALALVWWTSSAVFDAARWRAGELAVAAGVPADRVDAGFEWRNAHRPPGETATSPFERDGDACVTVVVRRRDEVAADTRTEPLPWPAAGVDRVLAIEASPGTTGCPGVP